MIYWFYGLSGSGKTTLAKGLAAKLWPCIVLDGDIIRSGLNKGLGFEQVDRKENIRRIAEMAKILSEQQYEVCVAAITPLRLHRNMVSRILGDKVQFIYCNASLKDCMDRDPKGLYKRIRRKSIDCFSGISSKFEPKQRKAIMVDTVGLSISESIGSIING